MANEAEGLVERLRKYGDGLPQGILLMREAAAEIEAFRKLVNIWKGAFMESQAEIERLSRPAAEGANPYAEFAAGNHSIGVIKDGKLIATDEDIYKTPDVEITPKDIDRALMTRIPGGSNARDWFVAHGSEKANKNVRDVVRRMLMSLSRAPVARDGAIDERAVYAAMDVQAHSRTSAENVSDVVKAIRALKSHSDAEGR